MLRMANPCVNAINTWKNSSIAKRGEGICDERIWESHWPSPKKQTGSKWCYSQSRGKRRLTMYSTVVNESKEEASTNIIFDHLIIFFNIVFSVE